MNTKHIVILILGVVFTSYTYSAKSLPDTLDWESNNTAEIWANPNAEKGGVFTDYLLTFPPTLRNVGPDSNSSFRSHINSNQLGLTSFHPNSMKIIPQLATDWAYGKDGKTVFYKLDKDAKWSDGEPVTADDFLFTLEFMRSKHINAPWYNNYYTEQILSVKKYDNHTISVTGAVARSKDELHYYYGINPTPKHFYKKIEKDWVKKYNWEIVPNTGPYQISDIKNGKQISFSRKENWWAKDKRYNIGRFNVDKVILKVIRDPNVALKHFEKGELDSYTLIQPEFWHKTKGKLYKKGFIEKVKFYNDMPRSSSGIFLNMDNPILSDLKVRKALAHAFNFNRVIKTVLRNDYERLQAFHTGYGEYSNKDLSAKKYNPKKASKLLAEAGWNKKDGKGIRIKDGKRLSLDLTYGRKEHSDRWAIIKQDALKAGIEINLRLLDPSAHYKTIMQKQHQMTALGWSTGFRPAFWQHFHSDNAHKPQTNNITNMDDKDIDQLIMSYKFETNSNKRISLANQLALKIDESAAFIPSFMVPYTRGAHWRWLKFPTMPGTKTSDSLYAPFGDGGLFWIDTKTKVETKAARKSATKYTEVNKVYDTYRVNPS